MKRTYQIRYGIIPARDLSQEVLIPKDQKWHNCATRKLEIPQVRRNTYREFYEKFQEDLQAEGVKNPILCKADADGTTRVYYGTTRATLCWELRIKLPVVIADFGDRWEDLEEIHTKEELIAKFKDPPSSVTIEEDWLYFKNDPLPYDPIQVKKEGRDWEKVKREITNAPTLNSVFSAFGATNRAHAKGQQ